VLIDDPQGVLGPASRTEAVADVQKFPLEDRFQHPFDRPLDDAVLDRGNAQRSLTTPGLGDVRPADVIRVVAAGFEVGRQFLQIALGLGGEPLHALTVYPRSAMIARHGPPGRLQRPTVTHLIP
jgi:hypothetical protein